MKKFFPYIIIAEVILIAFFAILIIGTLFKNNAQPNDSSSDTTETISQKVSSVINQIEEMEKSGFPTLADAKKLEAEYNSLTSEQKDQVTNYSVLAYFLSMDLDAMNDVQALVNAFLDNESSMSYKDFESLSIQYNGLSSVEREYISGYDELADIWKLSDNDRAALIAANFIKTFLKDENSMVITAAYVDDIISEGIISDKPLVALDYTASNAFGGTVSNSRFVWVDMEKGKVEETFWGLAIMDFDTASSALLKSFDFTKAKELDCDKLNAYLYE